MKIRFWGTRGSIPSPGADTVRYGGNTSCVEVRPDAGNGLIIIDAGSGIRKLGLELSQQSGPIDATLLLSHSHWDHIQGFPFFKPGFDPQNSFSIIGGAHRKLERILSNQMEWVYFPVAFDSMGAAMEFEELHGGQTVFHGNVTIRTIETNHNIYCLGFRIEEGGKSVVYLSDNELALCSEPEQTSFGDFVHFSRGTDLLIHDAQYTEEEYLSHTRWGHSTYTQAFQLAREAGVRRLAFFHHDPEATDEMLDERVRRFRAELSSGDDLELLCATEGQEIVL